jgi:hypothetical protein
MDKHIEAVRQKLLERSNIGISKYGVTLERTDLSTIQWLRHLQEELMDSCGYIERIISDLEKRNASS